MLKLNSLVVSYGNGRSLLNLKQMPKSFGTIYKKNVVPPLEREYNEKYDVLTTVQQDFEGRSVSVNKYVKDDPSTRYDGLRPSDFSLENQALVGVEKMPARISLQRVEIEAEIERVNSL